MTFCSNKKNHHKPTEKKSPKYKNVKIESMNVASMIVPVTGGTTTQKKIQKNSVRKK